MTLTYYLVQDTTQAKQAAITLPDTRPKLQELLSSKNHDVVGESYLTYALHDRYAPRDLRLSQLAGWDHAVVSILSNECQQSGLFMFLADLTAEMEFDEGEGAEDIFLDALVTEDGKKVSSRVEVNRDNILNEDFEGDCDSEDEASYRSYGYDDEPTTQRYHRTVSGRAESSMMYGTC